MWSSRVCRRCYQTFNLSIAFKKRWISSSSLSSCVRKFFFFFPLIKILIGWLISFLFTNGGECYCLWRRRYLCPVFLDIKNGARLRHGDLGVVSERKKKLHSRKNFLILPELKMQIPSRLTWASKWWKELMRFGFNERIW